MKKLVFRGPVTTASGYGVHARQLLKALIDSGKYDISVIPISWGKTPFLLDGDEFIQEIFRLSEKHAIESKIDQQYDISVQVTIPNEFTKLAKINIGVTAGIEVDRVSPQWIIKTNENIDLLIVPSVHSANTFSGIRYKSLDGSMLSLQVPTVICPEGVDTSVFNTSPVESRFEFDTSFNFLSIGLGLDRTLGEDRKNLSTLIKWFCEEFKDSKDVGLILKTGLVGNSFIDFKECQSRITDIKKYVGAGEFPRIYLVHGRLSDNEVAELYKHKNVKAYVSLTHGEGYGLPLIEAAACALPIIVTNWSGHLDFLSINNQKKFIPLDFDLLPVPKSAVWENVIEEGTNWAYVREDDTKRKLKKISTAITKPKEWANELAEFVCSKFTTEKTNLFFSSVVEQFVSRYDNTESKNDPVARKNKIFESLNIPIGSKTLLYTMPMSGGDVFISSAIVDSLKKKFSDHLLIFATDEKYKTLLIGNPNIDRIVQFEDWMTNVPFCETVFDEVYTPNLAIQTNHSNWVHGGKGRLLGNEMAAQCHVDFGEYFIQPQQVVGLPKKYVVLHTGAGKGQWEARNYLYWNSVVHNIKKSTGLPVVHIGLEDDRDVQGVLDFRGKTNYNQMAFVIQNSSCLISIDSIAMHMAAALRVPLVSIFGSSYSTSTGPVLPLASAPAILLDPKTRLGCDKACYKYTCTVDNERPCLNEVDPKDIAFYTVKLVKDESSALETLENFEEVRPKIAGYTHVLNADRMGYPYVESIRSMLGFCDEVVVVDGGSTDDTIKNIESIGDERVKIFTNAWDWTEPGMDGIQKSFGRAMVSVGENDFLWQQDADEVVHERDYTKIKELANKFPVDTDVVHLPVVELWGSPEDVRTDRHSWKWRMSRNKFHVTHGINKDARVFDEKTGKTFSKKNMSDGCEYIDIMSGEFLRHKGFYTKELEVLRKSNPEKYGEEMNEIFTSLPSVFHYSWVDIERKIVNFKTFWNRCWNNLYNDSVPVDRFPDVLTSEDVVKKSKELLLQGGEHSKSQTFKLNLTNPNCMTEWLKKENHGTYRFVYDDQKQTRPVEVDTGVVDKDNTQKTI